MSTRKRRALDSAGVIERVLLELSRQHLHDCTQVLRSRFVSSRKVEHRVLYDLSLMCRLKKFIELLLWIKQLAWYRVLESSTARSAGTQAPASAQCTQVLQDDFAVSAVSCGDVARVFL
jgi:hypothetical protein